MTNSTLTHIEHAQFGLAGLFLPGTCTGRLAVVFPVFSIPFADTSQALITITCLLPRRDIRVDATQRKYEQVLYPVGWCHIFIAQSCKQINYVEQAESEKGLRLLRNWAHTCRMQNWITILVYHEAHPENILISAKQLKTTPKQSLNCILKYEFVIYLPTIHSALLLYASCTPLDKLEFLIIHL